MKMELTTAEIETLIESLNYSVLHVSNAPDTPYEVRRDNIRRLEEVRGKLQAARRHNATAE